MTILTDEMRAEMRRAAEAATPGLWLKSFLTCDYEVVRGQAWDQRAIASHVLEADAAHIAASCPANVLALLDHADDRDKQAARADAAEAALARAEKERDEARGLADRLKLQAQIWSGEARAHKSSLHEAYQAATGAKGEPGNWNGARPIVEKLSGLEAALAAALERNRVLERTCAFVYLWIFRDGLTDAERVSVIKHRPGWDRVVKGAEPSGKITEEPSRAAIALRDPSPDSVGGKAE